jgi:hypothetical protein
MVRDSGLQVMVGVLHADVRIETLRDAFGIPCLGGLIEGKQPVPYYRACELLNNSSPQYIHSADSSTYLLDAM